MTPRVSSIFIQRATVLILSAWVALGVPVFVARILQGAEKAHWSESLLVMDKISGNLNQTSREAGYMFGYTFGYVGEQAVVGLLTGGTIKIGGIMAKGGFRVAGVIIKSQAFSH